MTKTCSASGDALPEGLLTTGRMNELLIENSLIMCRFATFSEPVAILSGLTVAYFWLGSRLLQFGHGRRGIQTHVVVWRPDGTQNHRRQRDHMNQPEIVAVHHRTQRDDCRDNQDDQELSLRRPSRVAVAQLANQQCPNANHWKNDGDQKFGQVFQRDSPHARFVLEAAG